MTTLIVLFCIVLLLLIIFQIARVRDLAKQLRGSEEVEATNVANQARGLMVFMALLLIITTASAYYFKNYILGFGPHESASVHGAEIDSMMKWTLAVTYVAYILTHIFLFYYAYKYRTRKGHQAQYISHNNTIELVWTGIPAIVMTFLVVGGLDAWNTIMSDVGDDDNYMEIEATGFQFAWTMRYPGPDGLLGRKDFRLISGANPLGQDWTDPKNHDDIVVNDVTLPVDQKVRVRITARDVLHDFYLPQFRVKMDAVPGLPTYFVFTPRKTTKEWRRGLSEYAEYQEIDPASDEGLPLWQTQDFELACAELCGIGHYSMKRTVTIMEQEDFDQWYSQQTSYYEGNVKGTDDDPLYMAEMKEQRDAFTQLLSQSIATPSLEDNVVPLQYVRFQEAGELSEESFAQLDNMISFLEENQGYSAMIMGRSDNAGDEDVTEDLSGVRAQAVRQYLIDNGIDAERLGSRGSSGTTSTATNLTEGGENRNPSIEIYITEGEVSEPQTANLSSK
ncbi:cytochrome c oxidase subunit 2 [Neolewinella xylanilytica]|uniref:Cytochrome c oxidase subunit 2 n=1 Tax=Neolewinella xylanilytica TaxID=1514080 RepID=A0A2S6I4T2_9BACT|nr:OmpA family protein [Neolewinella xylanilytica]PPK86162.1 cytochrome c oxidase subunit 2 [Neolewinella xylanilytica]